MSLDSLRWTRYWGVQNYLHITEMVSFNCLVSWFTTLGLRFREREIDLKYSNHCSQYKKSIWGHGSMFNACLGTIWNSWASEVVQWLKVLALSSDSSWAGSLVLRGWKREGYERHSLLGIIFMLLLAAFYSVSQHASFKLSPACVSSGLTLRGWFYLEPHMAFIWLSCIGLP